MLGSPIFSMPSLSSCTSTRPSLFLSRRSNSSTNRFSSPLGGPEGGLSPPVVTVPCIGHCSRLPPAQRSKFMISSIVLGHPEGRLVSGRGLETSVCTVGKLPSTSQPTFHTTTNIFIHNTDNKANNVVSYNDAYQFFGSEPPWNHCSTDRVNNGARIMETTQTDTQMGCKPQQWSLEKGSTQRRGHGGLAGGSLIVQFQIHPIVNLI